MTLIAWNSTGPILKNGAIGTEQACCCAQKNKVCTCSDPYGYAPASVIAEVTLGTLASGSMGSCAQADAAAQLDGTYVLPYVTKNPFTDDFVYSTTLANGTVITYETRCTSNGSSVPRLLITFCDIAVPCFQRISFEASLNTLLCDLTYGSTVADTFASVHGGNGIDSDLFNPFGGPVNCGSLPTYRAFFNVTVSVTPQW